jgi:PEP-CTERM motif
VRLTISALIFLAVLAPSVAAATPISDFDHPILVDVSPPGHAGSDAPHLRLDYAEYFADLPDFLRGMDPATLPEGFIVHGHGVALFYRRGATGPDASIAIDDWNEPGDEIAEVANGSIPVVVLSPPGGDALASDVGLPSAGLAYSSTVDSQGVTVTTPEPGSLILLGSGLLYSAARRGRRRR